MKPLPLDSHEIRLLTEIGMVGAGAGARLAPAVSQLFEALMVLRPGRDFPYVGQATAWLNQGRPEEAARVLERGLKIACTNSDSGNDRDLLQAFLGLALLMSKRTAQAQQLLRQLLAQGRDPQALRMARGLMGLPLEQPETEDIR